VKEDVLLRATKARTTVRLVKLELVPIKMRAVKVEEHGLMLLAKITGKDWRVSSWSWQESACSTLPMMVMFPPDEGSCAGVAWTDSTRACGPSLVEEAPAVPTRPTAIMVLADSRVNATRLILALVISISLPLGGDLLISV
jgi:hypothetical protein